MKYISTNKILKHDLLNLKNKLLIASPNVYEKDIFSQSIILIIEQNNQKTTGLIVNVNGLDEQPVIRSEAIKV